MELDGDQIRLTRSGQVASMSLQSMASAPSLRKGMLGTALTIRSGELDDVVLKAAGHQDAHEFSAQITAAWTRFNLAALEKEAVRLDRILAGVRSMAAPPRYPAACQISPLLNDARDLDASLLSKLNAEAIGPEAVARIAPVRKFATDPRMVRANAIATFVTAELDRWKDFFDTIESKPLTPEQRLSVVVDEDATLVLGGRHEAVERQNGQRVTLRLRLFARRQPSSLTDRRQMMWDTSGRFRTEPLQNRGSSISNSPASLRGSGKGLQLADRIQHSRAELIGFENL